MSVKRSWRTINICVNSNMFLVIPSFATRWQKTPVWQQRFLCQWARLQQPITSWFSCQHNYGATLNKDAGSCNRLPGHFSGEADYISLPFLCSMKPIVQTSCVLEKKQNYFMILYIQLLRIHTYWHPSKMTMLTTAAITGFDVHTQCGR